MTMVRYFLSKEVEVKSQKTYFDLYFFAPKKLVNNQLVKMTSKNIGKKGKSSLNYCSSYLFGDNSLVYCRIGSLEDHSLYAK
jgi:hypothetical protein